MQRKYHKILIVGANGMLGSALVRLAPPEAEAAGIDLPDIDITDPDSVARVFEREAPDLVVNAAAYTDVDGCESNFELADRVNGLGPGVLGAAVAQRGAALVHVSTDFVFDGKKREPYTEEDAPAPISAYGRTKLHGELAVARQGAAVTRIVRTSWLYGPNGKNFVDTMVRLMLEREEVSVVADQTGSPTYSEDLAAAIYALAGAAPGLYQFSNTGQTSWHGFASAIREELIEAGAPVKAGPVKPIGAAQYKRAATPPDYSVMSTEKYTLTTGLKPRPWRASLKRYIHDYIKKSIL